MKLRNNGSGVTPTMRRNGTGVNHADALARETLGWDVPLLVIANPRSDARTGMQGEHNAKALAKRRAQAKAARKDRKRGRR